MVGSFAVVLFDSTSAALRAEKVVGERGIEVKLIPVPRHISSDCGVCLRFPQDQEAQVRAVLGEAGVDLQGIYLV